MSAVNMDIKEEEATNIKAPTTPVVQNRPDEILTNPMVGNEPTAYRTKISYENSSKEYLVEMRIVTRMVPPPFWMCPSGNRSGGARQFVLFVCKCRFCCFFEK